VFLTGRAYGREAAPYQVNVPLSWGAFKGIRNGDLIFEDDSGTIRITELIIYTEKGQTLMKPRESVIIMRK
jgi:hypothetical protein